MPYDHDNYRYEDPVSAWEDEAEYLSKKGRDAQGRCSHGLTLFCVRCAVDNDAKNHRLERMATAFAKGGDDLTSAFIQSQLANQKLADENKRLVDELRQVEIGDNHLNRENRELKEMLKTRDVQLANAAEVAHHKAKEYGVFIGKLRALAKSFGFPTAGIAHPEDALAFLTERLVEGATLEVKSEESVVDLTGSPGRKLDLGD